MDAHGLMKSLDRNLRAANAFTSIAYAMSSMTKATSIPVLSRQ
jgi:hypothetical protein